jgi:hypothetical protein
LTVSLYCTAASAGDAVLTLTIYVVLVLANRRRAERAGRMVYAGAALLGVTTGASASSCCGTKRAAAVTLLRRCRRLGRAGR